MDLIFWMFLLVGVCFVVFTTLTLTLILMHVAALRNSASARRPVTGARGKLAGVRGSAPRKPRAANSTEPSGPLN